MIAEFRIVRTIYPGGIDPRQRLTSSTEGGGVVLRIEGVAATLYQSGPGRG